MGCTASHESRPAPLPGSKLSRVRQIEREVFHEIDLVRRDPQTYAKVLEEAAAPDGPLAGYEVREAAHELREMEPVPGVAAPLDMYKAAVARCEALCRGTQQEEEHDENTYEYTELIVPGRFDSGRDLLTRLLLADASRTRRDLLQPTPTRIGVAYFDGGPRGGYCVLLVAGEDPITTSRKYDSASSS